MKKFEHTLRRARALLLSLLLLAGAFNLCLVTRADAVSSQTALDSVTYYGDRSKCKLTAAQARQMAKVLEDWNEQAPATYWGDEEYFACTFLCDGDGSGMPALAITTEAFDFGNGYSSEPMGVIQYIYYWENGTLTELSLWNSNVGYIGHDYFTFGQFANGQYGWTEGYAHMGLQSSTAYTMRNGVVLKGDYYEMGYSYDNDGGFSISKNDQLIAEGKYAELGFEAHFKKWDELVGPYQIKKSVDSTVGTSRSDMITALNTYAALADGTSIFEIIPYYGDRSKCKLTAAQARQMAKALEDWTEEVEVYEENDEEFTCAFLCDGDGSGIPALVITSSKHNIFDPDGVFSEYIYTWENGSLKKTVLAGNKYANSGTDVSFGQYANGQYGWTVIHYDSGVYNTFLEYTMRNGSLIKGDFYELTRPGQLELDYSGYNKPIRLLKNGVPILERRPEDANGDEDLWIQWFYEVSNKYNELVETYSLAKEINCSVGASRPVMIAALNTYAENISATGFTDVPAASWYTGAVKYVVTNGLMKGSGGNRFNPMNTITRAEVITTLARQAGANVEGGNPWYQKAVDWAKRENISDGTNPGGAITRMELAAMLYRSAGSGSADTSVLNSWPDGSSVPGWAAQAMAWAVKNGIITGANGKLNPAGSATRAEVAIMMQRFCEKTGT